MRRSRRKKAVPMTWKQFTKRLLQLIFMSTWSALCLLRYLNPLLYIRKKLGHFSWIKYTSKHHLQKSWLETLKAYFKSEEASRRELLAWIKSQIPAFHISDLSVGWMDGIALCALVESLCPGACPRYDLLKADHKINNCRLALKLAQKHLGIPQDILRAEEIADPLQQNCEKIQQLLSVIHYMYGHKATRPVYRALYTGCSAKGLGLVSGVVGKKCNVKVIVPNEEGEETHHLIITIRGPNHEFHREVIRIFKNRNTKSKIKESSKGALLWKTVAAKMLTDNGSNSDSKNIPFQYKETPEGHFDITYIPKCAGICEVGIKWKDAHIKGSPFRVNITTTERLKELNQPLPAITTSELKVNSCNSVPLAPTTRSLNSLKISSEKDTSNPHVATAMAILQRSSTLHRSISKISGPENVKQGIVTRRKILKRIITQSGQEIIINAASISSNSVSSQDSDRVVERNDPDKDVMDEAVEKQVVKNKHLLKSFDFEGTYESDSSSNAGELSFDITDSHNDSTEMVEYIMNLLMNMTFATIRRNEQIAVLQKKKSLFQKGRGDKCSPHPSNKCIPFGCGKRHFSTSALLVPAFQKQFHCSPFTDSQEVVEKTDPIALDLQDETEKEALEYRKKRLSRLSDPSLPSLDSLDFLANKELQKHWGDGKVDISSKADIGISHHDEVSGTVNTLSKSAPNSWDDLKYIEPGKEDVLTKFSAGDKDSLNLQRSGSSDSSQKYSGTDGDVAEQGTVSVHTQMMDSNGLVTVNKDENLGVSQQHSCLSQDREWPSHGYGRKTASESDMSSFNCSRASSLTRSFSMSLSPFSSTYTSCSQDDDVFSSDPASLKLLTSDSMQKSCLYFSNGNAIEDIPNTFEKVNMSSNKNSMKLQASLSMPNMEVILKSNDTDSTEDINQEEEIPKTSEDSDNKISNKQDLDGSIIKRNTDNTEETRSKSSGKENGKTTSRRGSLARQQEVVVSENTSGSEDPSENEMEVWMTEENDIPETHNDVFCNIEDEADASLGTEVLEKATNTTQHKEQQILNINTQNQYFVDGIMKSSTQETGTNTCLSPRWLQVHKQACQLEKSTQVSYCEIKNETGWARPSHFLLRRRYPISVEDMRNLFQSLEVHKKNLSKSDEESASLEINKIVNDTISTDKIVESSCLTSPPANEAVIQETQREINCHFLPENMVDNSINTSSQKPKRYASGHKRLTRNRYKGKIKLDPLLVSHDPNAISDKDIVSRHTLLKRSVSIWANSTYRKNTVVKEKCWRHWKKHLGCQSKHGIRKRVKFSNRVLMYRRSSSRSTKYSSENSNDSVKDFSWASAQQNEEELTRIFETFQPIQAAKEPSSHTNSGSEEMQLDEILAVSSHVGNRIGDQNKESHNKYFEYSSLSSDGFGMDRDQRHELLREVDDFRRLSLPSNNNHHQVKAESIGKGSIEAEMNGGNNTNHDISYDIKRWNSDNSSLLNQLTPLGEDYVSFTGLLEDGYQDTCVTDKVNQFLDGNSMSQTSEDLPVPVPAQCIAFGSGLRYGQVGVKNNFQVRSLSAGHGSLGVSINGPKPHTVVETVVSYTGDDLYEVIYEVKYPGFYVITVKWADVDIPESPFICKVTF